MINARAETVQEKSSFHNAFKSRRCVVAMDAFYEWSGPKSDRIPHEISRVDGRFLAMAGPQEVWKAKDGSETVTFYTIVILEPNAFMVNIQDRMLVILEHENYDCWLSGILEEAATLMHPAPEDILQERLVNKALNNGRNEGNWLLNADAISTAQHRR